MWCQILERSRGTRPTEALPRFGIHKMAQRTTPPSFLFCLFRGADSKSETTIDNQLWILFHKCGLRFFGRASGHHTKNPTTAPFCISFRYEEGALVLWCFVLNPHQPHARLKTEGDGASFFGASVLRCFGASFRSFRF